MADLGRTDFTETNIQTDRELKFHLAIPIIQIQRQFQNDSNSPCHFVAIPQDIRNHFTIGSRRMFKRSTGTSSAMASVPPGMRLHDVGLHSEAITKLQGSV